MGNLGSISPEARAFSFLQNIQPGFESMQLSIQTTPGAVFPRAKRPIREGNHSPPFLLRFGISELHFTLCYNSTRCKQETSAVPLKATPCFQTLCNSENLLFELYINKILFRSQFMWRICSPFRINSVYFSHRKN
jgi:hypothetical protein